MNKELLNEALKALLENLANSKDFVMSQTPDVIQQLITLTITESIILIILCPVVLSLSFKATFVWSNQDDCYGDWSVDKLISFIIGGVASAIFTITAINAIFTLVKVTVAPKVFLLEYASGLIK